MLQEDNSIKVVKRDFSDPAKNRKAYAQHGLIRYRLYIVATKSALWPLAAAADASTASVMSLRHRLLTAAQTVAISLYTIRLSHDEYDMAKQEETDKLL